MAGVSEWIVREYFEILGYLVAQPRKYTTFGRPKTSDEEVDLLVVNPRVVEHRVPEHTIWTTEDLRTVARAVVGVRGGHSETFYAQRFEQDPDILRFTEPASARFAEKRLGPGPLAKILCIPRLAASGELKEKSVKMLKRKGVDGVMSFETILAELISHVDRNHNYEKSSLLQIVRILKNYDFIKDSQMEFPMGRKRCRRERMSEGEKEPADRSNA
ncbi:MAG: hypothetical protein QME60_00510 [Verrucomicrobiota bacterium]|nr:hypothetical protein [Verrucomicrobiota bacterium]